MILNAWKCLSIQKCEKIKSVQNGTPTGRFTANYTVYGRHRYWYIVNIWHISSDGLALTSHLLIFRECKTITSNMYQYAANTLFYNYFIKQAQRQAAAGRSRHKKSQGNSVLGVVFSQTMPKMDFHYSHRFSWEKIH